MNTPEGKSSDNWCNGLASQDNFDYEACISANDQALNNVSVEVDLKDVFKDTDLVIEALPEVEKIKRNFYKSATDMLPEKTILTTNSSTLLPSMFAKDTGRPEKFMILYFANMVWKLNTVEMMSQPETEEKCYNQVVEFARKDGMVRLCLHKEQSGYLTNTMLVPFIMSGLGLWADGVSDPQTIDEAWKLVFCCPQGPFEDADMAGIPTTYDIAKMLRC